MCGIWACVGQCPKDASNTCVQQLSSRGPESSQVITLANGNITLGFTRLAINDLTSHGMQPMTTGSVSWICNGEIYNHIDLKNQFKLESDSHSDCAYLGPLWNKLGKNPDTFFKALDGVFAIVLFDASTNTITVGRDPYGVRPLFIGYGKNQIFFGSEMKALIDVSLRIDVFSPGTWAQWNLNNFRSVMPLKIGIYHNVPWVKQAQFSPKCTDGLSNSLSAVRESLTLAVKKRVLATERPIAALLSGGVDSSLIAALVQKELKALGRPSLETYSIGFAGSTDLKYARKVADHIGSKHHEIVVTPDDLFEAIPEVIWAIESYDITTVRASVGNWYVCKEISKMSEAKVIFNGDGADEVFGSYLYFFRAPTDQEFDAESERLLKDIHMYDVLRSDRCISSHGLEARTPFLDKQFVATVRSIDTMWRRPRKEPVDYMERSNALDYVPICEKWLLRNAFSELRILPDEVLWRQKEAFSDGVSGTAKSWFQEIQDRIPEDLLSEKKYSHLPPPTAESRFYRDIFDGIYGAKCERNIPYFWMPKWSGETTDPSARTLSIYSS